MIPPHSQETMDFLVHCKVRIAATPVTIWPHIVALDWSENLHVVSIGGDQGRIGERLQGYADATREALMWQAMTVEVVPARRRTLRMEGLDGAFAGFTTFELTPAGDETIVAYDVYTQWPIPEGQASDIVLENARRGGDLLLLQLKSLVEGGISE